MLVERGAGEQRMYRRVVPLCRRNGRRLTGGLSSPRGGTVPAGTLDEGPKKPQFRRPGI